MILPRLSCISLALFCAAVPAIADAAEPAVCTAGAGDIARAVGGEVSAGDAFREEIGNGWTFALLPAGTGWDLRIFDAGGADLTGYTPPLRFGPNAREIYGWHFRNAENTGPNDGSVNAYQNFRSFAIAPELVRSRVDPYTMDLSDPAIAATQDRGSLTILDFELAGLEPGQQARMVSLSFETCLTWPESENAPPAQIANAPDIALRPAPQGLGPLPPPNFDADAYAPALNWGVGLLEPTASPEYTRELAIGGHQMLIEEFGEYIDWIARLDLPLFDAPAGAQWGWLSQGRVVDLDSGEEHIIPRDARLRVSYDFETEALFVMEEADDGWVQIRWGDASAPHGGRGWTHPAFQTDPDIAAEFHSWEDAFRNSTSRVSYRNTGAAHLMRAAPNRDAEIVHRIEGRDWDMEILEMRGDWIRVRVSWPSDCGSAPREGEAEGWTVWRSEDQGPWIYSPIGGC